MTQDLSVQNKRPSALPYALGGAAVAGGIGAGLAQIPALKGQKFNSWNDVLAGYKDVLKLSKEEGASEAVKNAVNPLKEQIRNFYNGTRATLTEARNAMTTETTALTEAKTKFKDLWEKGVNDIVAKIKNGDKISGLEVANTAPDEEIIAKARTYLREHMSDELKTAKKSLKDAWAKLKEPKLSEEQKKTIADKADECWKAVKDKVKDMKASTTLLFAAGAAAIGLVLGLVLRPKAKEQPAPQQGFVA